MENEKKPSETAATVTITGRGPIHIQGRFELIDKSGVKVIVENDLVKICGCGRSQNMPLCDGSHKR